MVFQIISPTVDIALVALLVSLVSIFVQHKFLDRKRMKELQQHMKERQKRMMELMKREDEQSKRELKRLEEDMNEAMQGIMKNTMKSMGVAFIYLPIFWALPVYDGAILPIGEVNLFILHLPNYYAYYVASSIVFSLAANAIWNLIEKARKGK